VKATGFYPRIGVDASGKKVVSHAGGLLLAETVRASGLDRALAAALAPWFPPLAVHHPAKIVCDLAVALALGGDCLADIALVRAEPAVFGAVASDPTVSRRIDALAADAPRVLAAIEGARVAARARVWQLAGEHAPHTDADVANPLIVDVDATLVTAYSDKEHATPTFKRGFGFHPLWAFLDHGSAGTGEPLAVLLRPGSAGSNTATDHVAVIRAALRQLPGHRGGRIGKHVLVRIDAAGATHETVNYLHARGLAYSIGFTLPEHTPELLEKIPASAWSPAYDADGNIRDGAWVAELTGLLNLSNWPKNMRVIARKERPHPGAQLRITDTDGHRITAFATNTAPGGPGTALPDLELRHRRRARAEDRIRTAKDTGLTNLPLHDFAGNQIWCALVALAVEITAWMQLLALADHQARRWEPKRLRLRLLSIAGRITVTARTTTLHLSAHAPWADLAVAAINRLRALPAPT
jgi:hypothetical protein